MLYRVILGIKWDNKGYFTTKLERISPVSPSADSPFRSRQAHTPALTLQTYRQKSILHRFLAGSTEAAAQHLGLASIGWKLPNDDAQPVPKVVRYRSATEAPKKGKRAQTTHLQSFASLR